MADPFTAVMGAVSIGSTIAGTAISAQGAKDEGEAKSQMYQYQAAIADRNAVIAKQNADYVRWAGEDVAQQAGLRTAFEIGQQKARQGASNLDVNFGSNVQVRESMHEVGWHDQQVIRSNAARQAYAYEQESVTQQTQAQIYRMGGADALRAGDVKAATTILGGVTSVASKWSQGSSAGMFGGGSSGGNAFLPSDSFMANSWGY